MRSKSIGISSQNTLSPPHPIILTLLCSLFFSTSTATSFQSLVINTTYKHSCWPYFPECHELAFLGTFPKHYDLGVVWLLNLTLFLAGVILTFRNSISFARLFLALLTAITVTDYFILHRTSPAPQDYLLILLALYYCICPATCNVHRFFTVMFCLCWATAQFDLSWITTCLEDKNLLVNYGFSGLAVTLLGILVKLVAPYLWLSRNYSMRAISVSLWLAVCFGLEPLEKMQITNLLLALSLATLLYLIFVFHTEPTHNAHGPKTHSTKTHVPTFLSILAFLPCLWLAVPYVYSSKPRLTFEGMRLNPFRPYGTYDCYWTEKTRFRNEEKSRTLSQLGDPYSCDPAEVLVKLQKRCKFLQSNPDFVNLSWSFFQSLNSQPHVMLVDVEDACSLKYSAFTPNQWLSFSK